jgi:reactive intermediate/imine deaminase
MDTIPDSYHLDRQGRIHVLLSRHPHNQKGCSKISASYKTTVYITMKQAIHSPHAPQAIGTYSQAIRAGDFVFLSGQLGIHTDTLILEESIEAEIQLAFSNLNAVCQAAGGSLNHLVKLNVYLTDLSHFQAVNHAMEKLFAQPFPARAAIGVASLPKQARIEIEGVLYIPQNS